VKAIALYRPDSLEIASITAGTALLICVMRFRSLVPRSMADSSFKAISVAANVLKSFRDIGSLDRLPFGMIPVLQAPRGIPTDSL
jgi:hypothetical protein